MIATIKGHVFFPEECISASVTQVGRAAIVQIAQQMQDVTPHTITIEGCQKVDPGSADPNSPDLIDTGNSCQCAEKWKGPFCGQPKCLMRKDNTTEIQCVHGTCTATETVSWCRWCDQKLVLLLLLMPKVRKVRPA